MSRRTAPHRPRPCFATCDGGFEPLLTAELEALGMQGVRAGNRGVHFEADRAGLWTVNLLSRLANRVLMPIAEFPAMDQQALYAGAGRIHWEAWMANTRTLSVEAQGDQGDLRHTGFVALVIKDAICDRFREQTGQRPNVNRRSPDVTIHARLEEGRVVLALDSSGARLHRRGYRAEAGEAPLKETLAASLIAQSGWTPDQPFVDPMCGAGTLVIEAALQAADRAPGLIRLRKGGFAFERWLDHDPARFAEVVSAARAREAAQVAAPRGPIVGSDVDPEVVAMARRNAARAGVADRVQFFVQDLADVAAPEADGPGVLITNPPYGERLGDRETLTPLYDVLGTVLKHRFTGWTAWVLAGEGAPIKAIGLRPSLKRPVRNGPLHCQLSRYELFKGSR